MISTRRGRGRAALADEKYLCLETFRRTGLAVMTPVWFAVAGESLYVGTFEKTGKIKRQRHTGRVRIAVCDSRGRAQSAWREAAAAMATGDEATRADQFLKRKHGLMKRLVDLWYRRKWGQDVVIAIRLIDPMPATASS